MQNIKLKDSYAVNTVYNTIGYDKHNNVCGVV